jgi:hypothetical protein
MMLASHLASGGFADGIAGKIPNGTTTTNLCCELMRINAVALE